MIPKIIHYCWFGGKQMPELALKCIESWKKHLPDYELRLWNEETFDINSVPYVKEAYEARKFAFVTDYVRLWALEREGGVYMDVDFEVYKSFDDLMDTYTAFAGYEGSKKNPVMMGILAAQAHHPWIQGMLATYVDRRFIMHDGSLDMTPNTSYFFDWMISQGFVADGVEKDWMGAHILSVECFCPGLTTGENIRSERTYCEHKGLHSWSESGGWKSWLVNMLGPKLKIRLIKLKRRLLG